jgi:hypothetical protein
VALLAAVTVLGAAAPAFAQAPKEEDAIVVISAPVTVDRDQVVDGVFVIDGDVTIEGTVSGDVFVISGKTLIEGVVEGDVIAVSGPTEVAAGAEIEGDLRWGDEEPVVSPQATIGGEINDEGWSDTLDVLPLVGAIAFWVGVSVSALILGIFLVLVTPRAADAVLTQARERLLLCVGFGLAVFVGLPLAILLASVTLIGLPLGIALLLSLLPLAAIAYVTTAWALGRALVKEGGRVVAFLAGLAILRALAILPVLGALVGLAAVIVGLGLLVGALGASRAEGAPAPAA